jgi:CRISPR-associated protein Csy2
MSAQETSKAVPLPTTEPALLLLPRLRVQNANAISSPLTWGFPAISAFLGFMTALERRLGSGSGLAFRSVGVVCHDFEAQVTHSGYTRAFHLTRNPVLADGSTAGIVEEGRVHLEVSLVFDVLLSPDHLGDAQREALAQLVSDAAAGMRLAGGSVMPLLPKATRRASKATLDLLAEGDEPQQQQFRRLARRCLPGFALVSRDDLLSTRLTELQAKTPEASALDAWLDLSRWNHRFNDGKWETDRRKGWTVPIPVGYAALSELHAPGAVAGARDNGTPFRFVESIWSMGQWVSPHRLRSLDDLLWYAQQEGPGEGFNQPIYRCRNDYRPPVQPV